jgi:hypothetical protein
MSHLKEERLPKSSLLVPSPIKIAKPSAFPTSNQASSKEDSNDGSQSPSKKPMSELTTHGAGSTMNPFLPRLTNLRTSPLEKLLQPTLEVKTRITPVHLRERPGKITPKLGIKVSNKKLKIVWPSSRLNFQKSPDHKISAKRIWPYEILKNSSLNADLDAVNLRRRSQAMKRLKPIGQKQAVR